MLTRIALALALAGATFTTVQVSLEQPAAADAPKSLYARLGGKDAIKAVVHDFLGNVAADTKINKRFAKTDIPKLEGLLVDQVCQATGGPCTYGGKDMKTAHQ